MNLLHRYRCDWEAFPGAPLPFLLTSSGHIQPSVAAMLHGAQTKPVAAVRACRHQPDEIGKSSDAAAIHSSGCDGPR